MESGTICPYALHSKIRYKLLVSRKVNANWTSNSQNGQSAWGQATSPKQMILESNHLVRKIDKILSCIMWQSQFDASMIINGQINQLQKQNLMSTAFQSEQKNAQQAQNAKILQRKQIEKRLQGLKTQEYEKIANNLKSQNEKLKTQVKILSEKVQELVTARKINKNKNPQIEQEIARVRRQLEMKYQSMHHLKEQVAKAKHSDMTEQMKMKIKEQINTVSKCEKQFLEMQSQKVKLKAEIEKNEADIGQYLPNNENDSKLDSIRTENRQLKEKINKIKQGLTQQQKTSKKAIGKIYELKDEQKRGLAKSSQKISASLKQIKSVSLSEINSLEREIEDLKNKKNNIQKDLVTDKIIKQSKKGRLQKQIKQKMDHQKQLYKKRLKCVNQLNLFQRKQVELRHRLQKEQEVHSKIFQNAQAQTQKIVPKQFRKEWIGKSQGLIFNDAEIIQYRGQTLIKAVTVYKTPQNIVFTKFHYQSPEKKKYQSIPPFQKYLLKKCEQKKYQSKNSQYLNGLIVSVHAQSKRVVRIQLKWSDGDSAVIGWDIQGSIRFPFDISSNQRPICMFGSVAPIAKSSYVLQSLGCQINSLEQ